MSNLIKNFSYSILANLFSLVVSVISIILIPKYVSVEDYGMWQLFLFYVGFLGFFHFGMLDGVYLRYAGLEFDRLDRRLFAGLIWGFFILQLFLTFVITSYLYFFCEDGVRCKIAFCAVILMTIVNFNSFFSSMMQITNRIKEYAQMVITGRVVFVTFMCIFFVSSFRKYEYLYLSYVLSISCDLVLGCYLCRSFLNVNFYSVKEIAKEMYVNWGVGVYLMFANIAGGLVIGIVRYGISLEWNVVTFGKISLTLAISNFVMVFISALSIAIFPVVKRLKADRLATTYLQIRNVMMIGLTGLLLFYQPLKGIIQWWLPKYSDSLVYMVFLLPICLYESKLQLLVNTYLKSLRMEKTMLKINLVVVLLSMMMTFVGVNLMHNLNLAVLSIVCLYAVRCVISELVIERVLSIKLRIDILVEVLMTVIFIICGVWFEGWKSFASYAFAYTLFCLYKRVAVVDSLRLLKYRVFGSL